ncbi:MAG: hypothetical protein ACRCZQ_07840 [Bacteroidales bacterium]
MRLIPIIILSLFLISFSFKSSKGDPVDSPFIIQTGNDTLNKDISNIISILGDDTLTHSFLNVYKSRNIYFVPQKYPDRIVDLVVYKGDPLIYKFRYDYQEFPYLPEQARKSIIIHEMYHIYKGGSFR